MRKIISVLTLIVCIISLTACHDMPWQKKAPDIEQIDWEFAYSSNEGIKDEKKVYYWLEDAPIDRENAKQVELNIRFSEGEMVLTNRKEGTEYVGNYQQIESDSNNSWQFSGNIEGKECNLSIAVTELIDWQTEYTGFDGNKYGTYYLTVTVDGISLNFFGTED